MYYINYKLINENVILYLYVIWIHIFYLFRKYISITPQSQ